MKKPELNGFILRNLRALEMTGVLMRIFSFTLVSWLGPASPFLFFWAFNTADAILLSWCAVLKRDRAYTLLNLFWIAVGVVGILRAAACCTEIAAARPVTSQSIRLMRPGFGAGTGECRAM